MNLVTLNMQPTEKQAQEYNGTFDIIDAWNTIQGEGPLAGTPATFLRLAGCNLQCPACDTDYTSKRETVTLDKLVELLEGLTTPAVPTGNLFVITGGEPFRQPIGRLISRLLSLNDKYNHVQIETNGTLGPLDDDIIPWYGNMSVVCSPKTPKINDTIACKADAFKYILDHQHVDPTDGLPSKTMGTDLRPYRPYDKYSRTKIFVQPLDLGSVHSGTDMFNEMNVQAAIQSCMKFGYRLSLQLHKALGLQ